MMRIKHRANRFVHRDFSRIVCSIRRTRFDSAFAALRDHRPAVTRDEPTDHIEQFERFLFVRNFAERELRIHLKYTAQNIARKRQIDMFFGFNLVNGLGEIFESLR